MTVAPYGILKGDVGCIVLLLAFASVPEATPDTTMTFRLVVERGRTRKVFELQGPQAVIGRGRGNAVRIPSAAVSRRHCRLLLRDGLVTVEDLDSINGTFLNGRRIKDAQIVRPGDRLEVGPVRFVVEYELTPAALARLQEDESPVEMLEALADGEVVDIEEIEEVPKEDFDAAPVVEAVPVEEPIPLRDEEAPIQPDFDFDAPWQVPGGGDLRDILSAIEDDQTSPPPEKKAKKKK